MRARLVALLLMAVPAGAREIGPDVLDALPQVDVVVLGEVHDNPAHHAHQARAVAAIRPAALVFEMILPDQAVRLPADRGDAAAMARALESQCVVVHAPTVGDAAWSPAVDENCGAAAIYGPPDRGFPPTGILAETPLNAPGWAYAEVDLARVGIVRRDGAVLNHLHWTEQAERLGTAGN